MGEGWFCLEQDSRRIGVNLNNYRFISGLDKKEVGIEKCRPLFMLLKPEVKIVFKRLTKYSEGLYLKASSAGGSLVPRQHRDGDVVRTATQIR